MKENRNAAYYTLVITVVSLICAIIIRYNPIIYNLIAHPDFIIDCLLGIFTGAFLSLILALIQYNSIKRHELTEYANFINCLNINIIPIYNLFRGGERNLEYEISLILNIYSRLEERLHMKATESHFFIKQNRIEKQVDEMVEMTVELYSKILDVKQNIDKYRFEMIDESTINRSISDLFMFLRNYDHGELYTNVLGRKHNKLLDIAGLNYQYSKKLNFDNQE